MFNSAFNFFRKRLILLSIIVVAVTGVSLYFASELKFTEDIADMIPVDNDLEKLNYVSENLNVSDKITVNIFLDDTVSEPQPEMLIAFADSFAASLSKNLKNEISAVKSTVDAGLQEKVYDIYYRNLHLFLTDDDYLHIDSLLTDSAVAKTLISDFQNIISPSGMISKKFITADPLSFTPQVLKRLNSLQFDESYEIYSDHIFTKDRRQLLLFLTSAHSANQTSKNAQLIKEINKIISKNQKTFPQVKVYLFGAPVIAAGNAERIKNDIILTVSIALVFLYFFVSFFYKSYYKFFIIFLPVVIGAIVSLAIIYLIKGSVSAVSLGIGSVLTGISIDYSLHIFTHFRKTSNSKQLFSDISGSLLMSSFTTSAAFFCLLFVSSGALHDLGLFAGISVFVSSIFALIILPHFVLNRKYAVNTNFIDKFTAYKFHANKYLIGFAVLISVLSFFYIGKSEFDADMDKMNYMSNELKEAEKKLNKTGNIALRNIYIVATGKNEEDALRNNEKIVSEIQNLKSEEIISSFSNISPVMVSDSLQNLRIQKWNKFWTLDKKNDLKQKIQKYSAKTGFSKNAFNQFYNFLFEKKSVLNKEDKINLKHIFTGELLSHKPEITTVVTPVKIKIQNAEKVSKALKNFKFVVVIDKSAITQKIVNVLKADFNFLVLISSAAVFVILLLYYGRIELAVVTYIPMIFSWIWTLALMSIFGQKFTIFNIIISTFIFGLGIDYSIFTVNGFLQEYRYGIKNTNSYKTSILLSGITTIAAIGVLIFAKHPALKSIAFLSVIGIISTIFLVYTLLPVLFNFLIKQQGKNRTQPVTFKDLFFSILVFTVFVTGSLLTIIFRLILQIFPLKSKHKNIIFRYWLLYNWYAVVYIPFNVKKIINNPFNEKFKKPAVIIANHQAHIDIPMILMLSPKIIVLTNDWVQKNIFYGKIVKSAEFYPVSAGIDDLIPKLKEKFNDGYSVLVFPEGTRSENLEIKRFHKGAFYIAEKLNAEILPVIIQGTGNSIPKGEPFLKSGLISVNIFERKNIADFGTDNKEQAKNFRKYFVEEYKNIRNKYETVDFYKNKLISNYIFKTPVLENYLRVKIKLEDNYRFFDQNLPKIGTITDIGCGYGFLAYMLNFVSPQRKIFGFDYDCQKIETAKNNISKNQNLIFDCTDVTIADFPNSDAFLLNDVLHYFPQNLQQNVIQKCINSLNNNGIIIIRDGNSELKNKHKGTVLTEIFSTKIIKFNKTNSQKLHFTSFSQIKNIAEQNNFSVQIVDNTKFTSNQIFILKKISEKNI